MRQIQSVCSVHYCRQRKTQFKMIYLFTVKMWGYPLIKWVPPKICIIVSFYPFMIRLIKVFQESFFSSFSLHLYASSFHSCCHNCSEKQQSSFLFSKVLDKFFQWDLFFLLISSWIVNKFLTRYFKDLVIVFLMNVLSQMSNILAYDL